MAAWKADYKKMLEEMIYEENAPSFEEMISELTNLKNKINALGWKFESDFPLSKKTIAHKLHISCTIKYLKVNK